MAHVPVFDPEMADESGLVAVGGDLEPRRLLQAYRSGVFPWYDDSVPICWWSPDPRAIFELDGFHCPRRLQRTIRSGRYEVTINQAFTKVMLGCPIGKKGPGSRKTCSPLICAPRARFAHSVEVWDGARLAGDFTASASAAFCRRIDVLQAIRRIKNCPRSNV